MTRRNRQQEALENKRKYKIDISAINKVRKSQGDKYASLPVKAETWYENLINVTSRKYGVQQAEFATKAISLRLSRYQATRLNGMNKQQAYTYINNIINKETFWGTSLDETIRKRNVERYGSDTINALADKDDALGIEQFKAGQRQWQEFLKKGNLKSI